MRTDYEVERRFAALDKKLTPMTENAKLILEVRQDNRTHRSEQIIIFLIGVEVAIGLGMFEPLKTSVRSAAGGVWSVIGSLF